MWLLWWQVSYRMTTSGANHLLKKENLLVVEQTAAVEFQKIHLYFFQHVKGSGGCDFELSQRIMQGGPKLSRRAYSPARLSCQHGWNKMHLVCLILNYYSFQFPKRLINGDEVRRCQHSRCMKEPWESRINGLTLSFGTAVFRDHSPICNLLSQYHTVMSYAKVTLPVFLPQSL